MGNSVWLKRQEVWTIFAGITALSWAMAQFGGNWDTWDQALCVEKGHCWCEDMGSPGDKIRQPSNAWSSLAFVFAGCMVVPVGMDDVKALSKSKKAGKAENLGLLERNPILTWLAASSYIGVGVSSFFFHSSLTYVGHWLDHSGMGLIVSWFTVMNCAKTDLLHERSILWAYLAASATYSAICWFAPFLSRVLFLGTMSIATYVYINAESAEQKQAKKKVTKKPAQKNNHVIHCLQFFGIAHIFWAIDIFGVVCYPTSWWQGHSGWHVANAIACLHGWAYFKAEPQEVAKDSDGDDDDEFIDSDSESENDATRGNGNGNGNGNGMTKKHLKVANDDESTVSPFLGQRKPKGD